MLKTENREVQIHGGGWVREEKSPFITETIDQVFAVPVPPLALSYPNALCICVCIFCTKPSGTDALMDLLMHSNSGTSVQVRINSGLISWAEMNVSPWPAAQLSPTLFTVPRCLQLTADLSKQVSNRKAPLLDYSLISWYLLLHEFLRCFSLAGEIQQVLLYKSSKIKIKSFLLPPDTVEMIHITLLPFLLLFISLLHCDECLINLDTVMHAGPPLASILMDAEPPQPPQPSPFSRRYFLRQSVID